MNDIKLAQPTVSKKQHIAPIWLLPIVALLVGVWLVWRSLLDVGPVITVEFESGEGIVANQTQVQYKGIPLGVVKTLVSKEDFSGVVATIQLDKRVGSKLGGVPKETQFWLVQPQVTLGGVSGLNTLFSGNYIGVMLPKQSISGEFSDYFVALKAAPPLPNYVPGLHITFKTDRFGEVKVPARDAVVIKGRSDSPRPAAAAATSAPAAPSVKPTPAAVAKAAEAAEAERVSIWDRFSPAVLTAKVRNYFGPWQGRLSLSTEVVSDVAERNNSSYEGSIRRKWKADEASFSVRFDYNETNDVATTDLVRTNGQWRRTFSKAFFGHYRPSAEWNRASRLRGLPNDYFLLQQELGAGYNLLTTPARKLRLGLSQNLFDRSARRDCRQPSRGPC